VNANANLTPILGGGKLIQNNILINKEF